MVYAREYQNYTIALKISAIRFYSPVCICLRKMLLMMSLTIIQRMYNLQITDISIAVTTLMQLCLIYFLGKPDISFSPTNTVSVTLQPMLLVYIAQYVSYPVILCPEWLLQSDRITITFIPALLSMC